MTNAVISPSHGAFFRRKRPFPIQKSDADPTASPAVEQQYQSNDEQRPPTAISTQSSTTHGSVTPTSSSFDSQHQVQSQPPSSYVGRSASVRTPTKSRSPFSSFSEALSSRSDARSTSTTGRDFPPSAFAHRSRASESASEDVFARDRQGLGSPPGRSPTSGSTSGPTSPTSSRRESNPRLPSIFRSSGSGGNGIARSMTVGHAGNGSGNGGQNTAQGLFQHIQSAASKRISALDYLRQVHEGDVYWFTTFQFQKSDFSKIPYFEPRKLARRATNYLLLGLSIPAILDPNSETAIEYLRAFNALLTEFESYQNIHSVDGQTSGSVGKSRIPQIFRRATQAAGTKSRRTSNPAEPQFSSGHDSNDPRSGGSYASNGSGTFSSFTSDHELLPGEEYNFLLTPSLPFEPDYFETFLTLCDVLIDCYGKIMTLVSGPEAIQPGVGDLFAKADAKVRKLLIAGLVQDFDEATKQGIRAEIAAINRLVLGPLMG